MKKIKIEIIIIFVICLFGFNSCIRNNNINNQLKFKTETIGLTKIYEEEVIMDTEDYELFYEIVDNLNYERKDELTTDLYEYEVSAVRTLEEDKGKLIKQKNQKFSCLYKVSTISKCVILECIPTALDSAYKEVFYASFDDEILKKINAIFDNYQVIPSNFTFGESYVHSLKYKEVYYKTNDDSFFEIVDKIDWVDVPMYETTIDNKTVVGMPDTFLVQTSRELYKPNDEDFKSTMYSVEYIIDLNTNYAQAFILTPLYFSAIYVTAIFEADISEYVDEFYDYFKEITPIHKVNVNNNLDMDYSLSKKYAFEGEEISVYITKPIGFDENTQKILMYVNENKFEVDNASINYYKFKMLNTDVKIEFEIVNKEKINNYNINYNSEDVLTKKLQESIVDAYLSMFDTSNIKGDETIDARIIEITKCYGIYSYNNLDVVPVFIETNFLEYDDEVWEENVNGCILNYNNSNRIYVYYNDKVYTLTDAYKSNLLTFSNIEKIVNLTHQQNIKDINVITCDEELRSISNKMNRTGGKVIRTKEEYNKYLLDNDVFSVDTSCEKMSTYNDYLNDDFFKTKNLIIVPYYVENFDEKMLFLQDGYYIDDNILYLDILLFYYEYDIASKDIPYTKYITLEVEKKDTIGVNYVYFRDPLSLNRIISTANSHQLIIDNYDYLSKYPTDIVYTGEEIKVYLNIDMMDDVLIYVNDEFYTSTYQVDELDSNKVLSFVLKIPNEDVVISFIHNEFVRKYINSYYMSYELQEEVLTKYFNRLTTEEKTSDDYAYIKKYYLKNKGYVLYVVSSRDEDCNVQVKQIGNYNFYNYSSQNLIYYYNDEIYNLETAYLNGLISDNELQYVCRLHNKSELDYYQEKYRVIKVEGNGSSSEIKDKTLISQVSKGLFIDDFDTFKKVYNKFGRDLATKILDSSIFDDYIVFVKWNFYGSQPSWTDYKSITINNNTITVMVEIYNGAFEAIMTDINFVFINKTELNNLSADELNEMKIEFINFND